MSGIDIRIRRSGYLICIFGITFTLLMIFFSGHPANAATNCAAQTEIPQSECEALLALHNSTNGDNWTNNNGWNVTDTPCNWYGIACRDGVVTDLTLYSNQLSGSIPLQIGDLTNLTALWLNHNQLNGALPNEIGSLTNLETLLLHDNHLSGSIPTEIGGLTNLKYINFLNNQLSGGIPPELGNLTNLENLTLSG